MPTSDWMRRPPRSGLNARGSSPQRVKPRTLNSHTFIFLAYMISRQGYAETGRPFECGPLGGVLGLFFAFFRSWRPLGHLLGASWVIFSGIFFPSCVSNRFFSILDPFLRGQLRTSGAVSYTHIRAHETKENLGIRVWAFD